MALQKLRPNKSSRNNLPKLDYVIEKSVSIVKEMPVRMRPREAMDKLGPRNIEDDALLAIFLRSGAKGLNVVDLASGLLTRFGSLDGISEATDEELEKFPGMGPVKIRELRAAMEVGRRMHQDENTSRRTKITTPESVVRLLEYEVRKLDQEIFWAIMLDAKNQINYLPVDVTKGILDASLVHSREVFTAAIRTSSAAVVLAHNHPSGDPTPSSEDLRITKQLVEAGKIIDIKVMDHVIVGKAAVGQECKYLSMREQGLADFS